VKKYQLKKTERTTQVSPFGGNSVITMKPRRKKAPTSSGLLIPGFQSDLLIPNFKHKKI